MQRNKHPCRQLNSESIKGAALCYISPIIAGKCSVVSAKCTWNVKGKALEKAWSSICGKRDACDKAVAGIKNVAFFFSAMSSSERKKASVKQSEKEDTDDDEGDEDESQSQVPSTTSEELLGGHRTLVNKKLCPAMAYWIALTTPNGAPANPLVVHRALLACGVEAVANQIPCEERKESKAMKELYKVLKDHKNSFMQNLVTSSYKAVYMNEAQDLLDEVMSSSDLDECGTENVVRVNLINTEYRPSLSVAMSKLVEAKLVVDQFGLHDDALEESTSQEADDEQKTLGGRLLSDKLTVLINDIDIAMKSLGYGLYRGNIYKKEELSKYTFAYKCEARVFVGTLAANEHFKARLLRDMKKVTEILSDPYCEAIRPLTMDYNLIEVMDGQCWSIKERQFVVNAVDEKNIGRVSPRAFCKYDPSTPPDPKYFREILENSLTESEVAMFCEDFLKLLHHNKKGHKDRVPCLVGATNSGKTSLFLPILGVIHHSNVATVTKQRSFNKAMITKFTEVVFIDEACESTLDVGDWKILTQGGYTAHDVKYQTAKSFINRCPMLVTSQRPLVFSEVDQPAMDQRLRTYKFKSLAHPKKGAAGWLKRNPMDCIVWASTKAQSFTDDEEDDEPTFHDESDEGVLREPEKEALRTFPLKYILGSDQSAHATLSVEGEETNSDSSQASDGDDRLKMLEGELRKCPRESLRYRQIAHMVQSEARQVEMRKAREEERYRCRQKLLKAKGVSTQNLNLLPRDDHPLPTPITNELNVYAREEEKRLKATRERIASEAFRGQWLRDAEVKLSQYVQQMEYANGTGVRTGTEGMINLLLAKLRTHHRALGTLQLTEALEERRKVCTALGLLDDRDHHLVTDLVETLPLKRPIQDQGTTQDVSDEDESMFITPISHMSTSPPTTLSKQDSGFFENCKQAKQAKRLCHSQAETPKRKKQKKVQGNTLLNYFGSQRQ